MRHVSVKEQAAAAQAETDEASDDEEEEEEEATTALDVENEMIKRQVQKDMQARLKAGRRKTRNNAKLSIKGKLVHKDMW